MRIDARIDERTMRELYLPMFEAAVKKANVASVMCAYNKINGPFACESKPLLEDILRGDWGFEGMTIADYNAAHDASASLIGGLDIEPWPGIVYGPNSVNTALATGPATMADVDRHILRYLRTLFAYGAMDRAAYEPNEAAIDQAGHAAKSRRVAEEGIVLLRNDGLLPLKRKRLDSIAVIGPGADAYLTGGGSSEIKPFAFTSPLEGITQAAGKGVDGHRRRRHRRRAGRPARRRLRRGDRRSGLLLDRGRRPNLPDVRVPARLRRPGRADRGRGRGQPEDRGRDGERRPGPDPVEQAGGRRARGLVSGLGGGQRDGPGAVRQGRRLRPPAGDVPAQRGAAADRRRPERLPRRRRHRRLRRGPARRLSPLRRQRHQAGVPVRPRPLLHELSLLGSARRAEAARAVSVAVENTGKRRGVAVPQLYLSLPSQAGRRRSRRRRSPGSSGS